MSQQQQRSQKKSEVIDLCGSDDDDGAAASPPRGGRSESASAPLMEGEAAALRTGRVKSWEVRPSRDFDPGNAGDFHYRVCEAQFNRMLGAGSAHYKLVSVRYVCNPRLASQFERRKKEYDRRFGPSKHTKLLAFHGTKKENVDQIISEGFKLEKVGSTTDPGYFGKGLYFSEFASTSVGYCYGGDQLLLCRVLLGRPYKLSTVQMGRGLEPGYTSHMTDAQGTEVVIFREDCVLPNYVLTFRSASGGGGPAAPPPFVPFVAAGAPAATAAPAALDDDDKDDDDGLFVPAAPAVVAVPVKQPPKPKRKRVANSVLKIRDNSRASKTLANFYRAVKKCK